MPSTDCPHRARVLRWRTDGAGIEGGEHCVYIRLLYWTLAHRQMAPHGCSKNASTAVVPLTCTGEGEQMGSEAPGIAYGTQRA